MKKYAFFLFLFLLKLQLFSQNEYFQQEVNYKIEVNLNDQLHELTGNISIEYKNNSPTALSFLYFHLWPNAYKNKNTAYAKQALQMDDPSFYFSSPDASGNISQLDFKVNGKKINWELEKSNIDITKLFLNQNLKSGESINITTPFKIKIPENFSRLGHDGQSYQITQWYPKPAVFDKDGWHQMPYLDSGEFYSEFGNFDVKITLPANYVVGATGSLQNESEQKFLQEKIEATNTLIKNGFSDDMSFPASSSESKTLHYLAEQVHDFAWFADKRFHVQKAEALLSNGNKVATWAMFTNLEADIWKDATSYLSRAIQFYSDQIGAYPYPQATAVESALFAGGAMEYPMITVVASVGGDAQALDRYITHEIGHNWFYGILASNERDHPWMDEGLNSYYENRYMHAFYENPDEDVLDKYTEGFLGAGAKLDYSQLAYQYQARRNLDQAPDTHSLDLTSINYGVGAYMKPALSLKMLEEYVGQKSFDKAMQQYFQQWKYKHPQPIDYRAVMEKSIGKKLDWLFDGFLFSNQKMDYKLENIKQGNELLLTINNKGEINAPFPVSGILDGKIVETKWYDGFSDEQEISFPKGNYDRISIDESQVTLDLHPKNNTYKLHGVLPKFEPLKLKILAGVETANRSTLYYLPLVSWNKYDKGMLGAAFYNTIVPANKFEFVIAPMYALGSKSLNGLADLKYNILPKKTFQKITIGASWKSFNYNYNELHDYFSKYQRLVPSLSFELKKRATSNVKQKINLRGIILFEDVANFDSIGNYTGNNLEQSTIYAINYTAEK
ncbi:MAG TPA: M1 family peptidase, partial [Saprospiraceae bacterium]|nr:M1 family peptidase [Saprospiraceae bacterium]